MEPILFRRPLTALLINLCLIIPYSIVLIDYLDKLTLPWFVLLVFVLTAAYVFVILLFSTATKGAGISGLQGKKELATLKRQLADYMDCYRDLEYETEALSRKLSQMETANSQKLVRLSNRYDKEIIECRRLVEETAKEKSKLMFDLEQWKFDYNDNKNTLERKIKEANNLQDAVSELEKQLGTLQISANKARNERDQLAKSKQNLQSEVDSLNRQLESEITRREFLENELKYQTFRNSLLKETRKIVQQNTSTLQVRFQEIQEQNEVLIQEIGLDTSAAEARNYDTDFGTDYSPGNSSSTSTSGSAGSASNSSSTPSPASTLSLPSPSDSASTPILSSLRTAAAKVRSGSVTEENLIENRANRSSASVLNRTW